MLYKISNHMWLNIQMHSWSLDANQYVADEDDNSYSCRVSGSLLLEEIVNACGAEGVVAICDGAKRRFKESQQAKTVGSTGWWRIREATLFALASVSERLLEAEESEVSAGLSKILEQVLAEDMTTGVHDYPFLHARMFSSAAKFSSMINTSTVEHLIYAATRAIAMDVPPPVKVGACRALSELLPDASKGIIQPNLMELFSSLTDLLNHASDETMHLVLETLQAAVVAGHESIAPVEPILSPIILNMWASHVSDPFISIDALEVLEAIRNAPGCFHPLASRVLPYIHPILNNPQQQPDGLVAGSLDLATMLLNNAPTDVVKGVYEVTFDLVIRIILQTDDHSEMQNATQCLASLISGGKQDLLSWGSNSGFIMRSLLDVASRLLDPEVESSGSLFVGNYILQLILHFPTQMAKHIRDLVSALIRRMQSSQSAGLRSSLLLIFARLIHMSVPQVEQFIDLLITIPAEGHQNSLTYLISEWTRLQGEVQGAYQIKVTTTALALLLATRHNELEKIIVQGHLIKSTAGITTRSRAKVAPDQWTSVPVAAKILALLADTLIEIEEQVIDEDDQVSDWEEIQSTEVEANKDLLNSVSLASHSRPSYNYLDALAKTFTEDQDDSYQDDLFCHADPLNEINMVKYLAQCIANFSQSDGQYFDQLLQNLTKAQRDAIQMVLNQ
ncbi:hypothetical protein Leryth_020167 [Lithospermum erythrorhizon]|nr:hypothetical protein Leryth_020167 [Lithospermum erythrorhizon]